MTNEQLQEMANTVKAIDQRITTLLLKVCEQREKIDQLELDKARLTAQVQLMEQVVREHRETVEQAVSEAGKQTSFYAAWRESIDKIFQPR